MADAPVPNEHVAFDVLLERDGFVAVCKPRGIASEPGPGHRRTALLNGMVARWPAMLALGNERDFGLLHRLDRDTSGIVLGALDAARYDELRGCFAARRIGKCYLAVVRGRLSRSDGTCSAPLSRVRRGGTLISVPDPRGQEAVTHWTTLAREGDLALLDVRIETGRTHQIRVHLALEGAAVEGDRVYRPLLPPDTGAFREPSALRLHARAVDLPALRGCPDGCTITAAVPAGFAAGLPPALGARLAALDG